MNHCVAWRTESTEPTMFSIVQQLQSIVVSVLTMLSAQTAPSNASPQHAANEAPVAEVVDENEKEESPIEVEAETADEDDVEAKDESSAELLELLDKIEAASKKTETLKATVRYSRLQPLLGAEQVRFGTLHYVTGPPARFSVHFDKLVIDDRMDKQNRRYIFDGRWLAERLDDQKQFRKWEVVPPDQDAAAADPLALGEGPFAVPVAFEKDRVLKRFDVKQVQPNKDQDPKGETVHLTLQPKPGHDRDIDVIDLWYDTKSLMPVRAVTIHNDGDEHTIDLSKIETGVDIKKELFDTRAPSEQGQRGYDEEIQPWEGKKN